ncbi:HNH endonuclease signature motif containing protein [Streptomyces sp. NPDC056747]|uniref:HNH endonuclease signature motif containing protein n=1 Tax=Streptomyces sp. NPDC056747 TaxID=3345935 RepID=UPI003698D372
MDGSHAPPRPQCERRAAPLIAVKGCRVRHRHHPLQAAEPLAQVHGQRHRRGGRRLYDAPRGRAEARRPPDDRDALAHQSTDRSSRNRREPVPRSEPLDHGPSVHHCGAPGSRRGHAKRPGTVFRVRPEGSSRENRDRLHRALAEVGVPYSCVECGNEGAWRGRTITLQIDHINRDWLDNRRENLRYLCPNCHAMTETWCRGKHRRTRQTGSA